MSKKVILAANWKMNNGPKSASEFISSFMDEYSPVKGTEVVFFPPALSLSAVNNLIVSTTPAGASAASQSIRTADVSGATGIEQSISTGVQNIYWEEKGAFTGELSAQMVKESGAKYVLVGHSERRHVFGETDEECAKKCAAAEAHGLLPMLCVGEKLEEREAGITKDVVLRQLKAGLSMLKDPSTSITAIAYEPVWAIGTGKNATPEDAAEIHQVIRQWLKENFGAHGEQVSILYGGSVKPENARELLDAKDVDGLLVGGASLDVSSWLSICSV